MKEFIEKYEIHRSYLSFFSTERINYIEEILDKMENITPERSCVFRALHEDLSSAKVLILGQDPYPQEGVATGLAFQVNANSWLSKEINTSLKNILKLLYFSSTQKRATIEEIRSEINLSVFKISSPRKLLDSWAKQGVLLLNTALTTEVKCAGKHLNIWKNFMSELIEYITDKNPDLYIFLWGNKVMPFKKFIKFGTIIESNHPAICGNLENSKDFLNNNCFIETKKMIDWLI